MILLALDVAKNRTGWAVDQAGGGAPLTGSWSPPTAGMPIGYAGLAFQKWLHRFVCERHVEQLVYEAPHVGGGKGIVMDENTTLVLIGLAFSVEVIGASLRAPVFRGHVGTWRKHFLGTGRPENPKQAALDRCKLLGWNVEGHDAAEAAGLWAWAKASDPTFRLDTTPLLGRPAA